MDIDFSLAKIEDVDEIILLFENAIDNMNRQSIFQWDEVYPNREVILADIESRTMYVGRCGEKIASVFVIDQYCDDEYKGGNWQYKDLSYRIVHRLCVNPDFQNKGIGTYTMNYIEKLVKQMGVQAIRLDCFTQNLYAISMYKKLGYNIVGYADWRKGRFCLMERKLL